MTSYRLIQDDALSGNYVTWSAPEVCKGRAQDLDVNEAEQIDPDQIRRRAWDEGFAEGRQAGLAAGQQEVTESIATLERVLQTLARPLEELDVCVEEEILALVKVITRHVIRREFKLDPAHIVGIIREGLGALPSGAGQIVIKMHPEDAEVVRKLLGDGDGDRSWSIEADPVMERGGCEILADESRIDCRLETRLSRVLSTMFESERANDE